MPNYPAAASTALRMIADAGFSTRVARVESSYDPVTSTNTITLVRSQSVTVVCLPGNRGSKAFDNKYADELIKGKLRFFYVAAKGLTYQPEQGDLIEHEGKVWELLGSTPLNPAGVPILYTISAKPSNLKELPKSV